jgi:hypothetical protein
MYLSVFVEARLPRPNMTDNQIRKLVQRNLRRVCGQEILDGLWIDDVIDDVMFAEKPTRLPGFGHTKRAIDGLIAPEPDSATPCGVVRIFGCSLTASRTHEEQSLSGLFGTWRITEGEEETRVSICGFSVPEHRKRRRRLVKLDGTG